MSSPELDDALLQNAAAGITVNVGANKNARDSSGNTALMLAVANGHYQIVKQLLEAGVDTTITNNNGATPLLAAVESADVKMVELLLASGRVNPDQEHLKTHRTPLYAAASLHENQFDSAILIVEALIKHGADETHLVPVEETRENDGYYYYYDDDNDDDDIPSKEHYIDAAERAGNKKLVDMWWRRNTKLRPRVVVPPLQF